jgi:asparagine synthase (glutamine-hydrolysing)
MCGIVGLVDLEGRFGADTLRAWCKDMADALVHRGPDDGGVWISPDGRTALGQRRLSMLSPAGGAITFNGEIYNFPTLRAELEGKGAAFRSHCDTEVLLAGLDQDGESFLDRVDGMYAFAHWDGRSGRLLLARDRFGEKPLYTYRSGGLFAFASELSAIARLPSFDDRVSRDAIAHYLCFQYVPAPGSIYAAAAKLEPGTCVELGADGSLKPVWRWRFRSSSLPRSDAALGEKADALEEILLRSVRDRLISDVPLGAFLSGGVDSSTVVAMVTKRLNRSIQTFSIGFDGAGDSEHEDARAMARHLGTRHADEILRPASLPDVVRQMGAILDEPNGDSSIVPTWFLSRLARRSVTVALSGDGGDEMFGGYGRYFSTLTDTRASRPDWSPGSAYYSTRILFLTEPDFDVLFGGTPPSLAATLAGLRGGIDADPRPLMNRLRDADASHYLPGAVLAKVDRMSMQHSLEVRSPLLGNEVAAFAAALAEDECWDGVAGKRVLKEVARRYVPAEWIDRPKRGFGLPMREWAEGVALKTAEDLLAPGCRLAEWLGQDALGAYMERQRRQPLLYHLWALMVLETWLRSHSARPA